MILRLYNPSETRSCDVALSVNREVQACCETDMNEVRKAQGGGFSHYGVVPAMPVTHL